ncbi:MAG: bifunctional demethylmenaquinone methyltransferase/2-methoxy-6-polyprenyl-1,4-benzoquinol methylase UbiE [Rickettsiaceae bacterium]|nr:bifunctional demethylmenaquinone methyltransferase/2-methoxy-6-polyprenyl-1,4-benzoquinol methylase UbiE [Rickettsiaceae bacterium]
MNEKGEKNFGFKKVSAKEKRSLVDGVFSDVAGKYDLMNDFMSFGIHRLWKEEFCRMIPNMDSIILDVAGGTGDISFRLKEKGKTQGKNTHIVVSDINKEMLDVCQSRAIDRNILNNFDIVVADAEKLPFSDNSFDYYTIAFGIRNVVSIENALAEALRVLKPTGKFLCLEFSKVRNNFLKPLYDFYTFNVIPKIGNCVAGNQDAYRYLAESISLFPDQEDFKTMIQKVGFTNVAYKNLTFGTAAIHYGFKGQG